jgi:hypothetical protein
MIHTPSGLSTPLLDPLTREAFSDVEHESNAGSDQAHRRSVDHLEWAVGRLGPLAAAGNHPGTTRYNYLLAAAQLARCLAVEFPDPDAMDQACQRRRSLF